MKINFIIFENTYRNSLLFILFLLIMTLSEVASLVEIIGIIAIVLGLWLGLLQLKMHRKQQRDLAIMECARSFEDREFTEAYRLITELEDGVSLKQIKSLGIIYEEAALRVGMKFETIGLLVYKGVVPMDAMQDLVGDAAITIWKVLEKYTEETRIKRSHSTFWEWYQWLVDRLQERSESKVVPAHILHKNWKPIN